MEPRILARIESWALGVAARVQEGLKVEDSRVELKRDWPMAEKAARQLAGLANAARGSEVLWIIGLDENDGVTGVEARELSDWWSMMQAQFDGITPSLTDVAIRMDGKSLWALAFDTSRAPFVVKNSMYGKSGGGAVSREVPWREGTAVRSATRNDLIQLLTPIAALPEIEILDWRMHLVFYKPNMGVGQPSGVDFNISVPMYVTPRSTPTIIPFHRCHCRVVAQDNEQEISGLRVDFRLPWLRDTIGGIDSVTGQRTSHELIVNGPCRCDMTANVNIPTGAPDWLPTSALTVSLSIYVIDASMPVLLEAEALPEPSSTEERVAWTVSTRSGAHYA
jgi:hypothetical protein